MPETTKDNIRFLAFGSGCANRQGAAAFYQAQEDARQPLSLGRVY